MAREVVMVVGGYEIRGLPRVEISRPIESIAASFSVELPWIRERRKQKIELFGEIRLYAGDDLLLRGYLDDVMPEYQGDAELIRLNGRSATGDLVDCSVTPKTYKNQSLLQIVDDLVFPFGIEVRPDADLGKPFPTFIAEAGETIYEALDRAARLRAVWLMTDTDGALLITRAGKGRAQRKIVEGENVLEAKAQFSYAQRHSVVTAYGTQPGSDTAFGVQLGKTGVATDPAIRTRPLVLIAEDNADAATLKQRAEWERNTRRARTRRIEYTLAGWDDGDQLWQPNRLVPVIDTRMGISQDMLIANVTFRDDEEGQRVTLTVADPVAFDLIEQPAKETTYHWPS